MAMWLLIAVGVIVAGVAVAVVVGRFREGTKAQKMEAALFGSRSHPAIETVDFDSLGALPPPVIRYFRHVLTDGQGIIRQAVFRQKGTLRTGPRTRRWSPFSAKHLVVPLMTGFVWDARIALPWATHVRVLDSYAGGIGLGRVSLLSAFPVASAAGAPEMNSGALHRYLAEAVWYPTALLPQFGVVWSPVDDTSALASLTDGTTTVSLEFRFNEVGEVTGIYTPGRWGSFGDQYKQVPWEGHFRDYRVRAGMRVPLYGEVGWYDQGTLQLVWKGQVTEARYQV